MVANMLICISWKQSCDLNLKNYFPKRIFQWNLAQTRRTWIDLHYWNIFFNYLVSKWQPEQSLSQPQNMLISCLLPKNGFNRGCTSHFITFFSLNQKKHIWYSGNYKKRGWKIFTSPTRHSFNRGRKNKMLGPTGPPCT